ncbi:MAG: hypothetical protein AABY75_03580, partial [Bacteroidota bacterium]
MHHLLAIVALVTAAVAQPKLTTPTDSLDAGSVRVGQTGTALLVVKNTGSAVLTISAFTSSSFALKSALSVAAIAP